MKDNRNQIKIRSGLHWMFLVAGLATLILAGFASIGGAAFSDVWVIWFFGLLGIYLFKRPAFWLIDDNYIELDVLLRKKLHNLNDLTWVEFRFKNTAFFWFGEEKKEINLQGASGKKIRAAIEKIGSEKLPYFGYELAERSKLSRDQLSGCLDCHQVFTPSELKNWDKLPKSFWLGRKSDQYFSRCPECKGWWVYTIQNSNSLITSEALQKMDTTFPVNKETKLREIIGETMGFQTSFQYFK